MGLDPELVGKLLQASITGAGLVLAVYGLILPLAPEILRKRAKSVAESKEAIRRALDEDLSKVKPLAEEIESKRVLPAILGLGIGATFCLYCVSALLTWDWSLYFRYELLVEFAVFLFGVATIIFLGVGLLIIYTITSLLKERLAKELIK